MNILKLGFIVVFMAMLILPLVFVDLSSDRVSVQENRMLANRPAFSDIKNHPKKFINDFDDWYKDSTGFREQFLTLYNEVGNNKYLRGVRYTNGKNVYLVGEQGHHYYFYGPLIKIFQGKQLLTDEKLSGMAGKLEEVKTYLESKGIPLIFMICASKESIYPEYYPKSIKRNKGEGPIQLDMITNYIKEHTSVDVFSIKNALLAEKDNYLMYPVSSGDLGHYTEIGAFFAYRELMKHINKYFPDITPYKINDIEINYEEKEKPKVSLKQEITYKKIEPSFFDDVELARPFFLEFENTRHDLPVILIFRDSFCGYYDATGEQRFIIPFIAQHFSRTVLLHYINIEHFEEFVDKYKPNIVVFETVEYALDNFADSVVSIPELSIKRNDLDKTQ